MVHRGGAHGGRGGRAPGQPHGPHGSGRVLLLYHACTSLIQTADTTPTIVSQFVPARGQDRPSRIEGRAPGQPHGADGPGRVPVCTIC